MSMSILKDCYKKTLVCQLEEHEHSLACYANPNADVESASVWEQSVSGAELTGIWADYVLLLRRPSLGMRKASRTISSPKMVK